MLAYGTVGVAFSALAEAVPGAMTEATMDAADDAIAGALLTAAGAAKELLARIMAQRTVERK